MFGRKEEAPRATDPTPAKPPEPKYKIKKKIADLTWEITGQPDSGNFRLYKEDGTSAPISDINTILLWEILKALSK